MESRPKYGFLDVAWAPVRALSAKQIGVMTVAVVLGLVLYNLFTYAAYYVQGDGFDVVYAAYGFFPFEFGAFDSVAAKGIHFTGIILAGFLLMLGFCGVAAINIEAMRGNRFMSFTEGLRFARSRARQIFLAELAIVTFVAFIAALFLLLGLVTRIPLIGEWLYALIFFVPNFFIALFTVFIIFALPVTVLLLPSIAASQRNSDVFSVLLELFSTLIRTPMRWLLYTGYSLVAAKLASFVYAYFCYRAVQFITAATSLAGGKQPEYLVRAGLHHLPIRTDLVDQMTNIFPGIKWAFEIPFYPTFGADRPVAYVMTFMLFLIFASVIGYFLAVIASAQARGYVALRQIKDGHRIAEEPPLFGPKETPQE
ncbi:MAG: hypothetical protein IPH75_01120 [bacterium]|nr:hypothetical protein [bacterium]